jgi:predicted small lipoprotein YifL
LRIVKKATRALIVLGTSTLVVCGVKGPPRPPAPVVDGGQREEVSIGDGGISTPDAGLPDAGSPAR